MSQQANNTLRLTRPDAGQTVTVPLGADNMRLSLGFEPDPNAVAKNGQNLEFSFEDGGTLVLEGYYDHFANKTLPVMVTENGDELSGEDFLASLREDLLTAAGPSAGPSSTSGGSGEYADDPGSLVDGVDRLGSLDTIYWGNATEVPEDFRGVETPSLDVEAGRGFLTASSYSLNESEAGFSLFLNLTFPAPSAITVQIQVGGSASQLEVLGSGQSFRSDFSIPDGANYSYDPATGILTVVIPAGQASVEVPVNLIDDHINDAAKDIIFTVVGTTGPVMPATGVSTTVNISEDSQFGHEHGGDHEPFIYDGPIVGFDEAGSITSLQEGEGSLSFRLNFTDPHTGQPYAGFEGDNLLSQDMTISVAVRPSGANPAVYGEDYEIDLDAITAMPGVKSASYDAASGTLTIELWGRVDAAGNPHPAGSGEPFRLDGPGLSVEVAIINDTISEREDETFELEITGSTGNESMGEGTAQGTIKADDRGNFNGPEFSLVLGSLHESNVANDPYYAPAPGSAIHTINLSKTAAESIAVWVSLNDGTAKAGIDYERPATMDFRVTLENGGTVTVTGSLDSVTGKYFFTVPEGAVRVEFTVDAVDNALENRFADNGGIADYEVGLGLVKTDANGVTEGQPGYDASTGLADGEATIAGTVTDEITQKGQYQEDMRSDGDELNPDYFDGPLVYFTGVTSVNESAGVTQGGLPGFGGDDDDAFSHAVYHINLKNPDGQGADYAADEDVTVTFSLALNGTTSLDDIDISGLTYWYTDANGVRQEGEITVTPTSGSGPFEFSVTVPAGSSGLSFQVPIVDDHVGGPNESEKGESFSITITGLSGNESRLPGSEFDGTYETDTAIDTEIVDDSGDTLDGPIVGAIVNTVPNGGTHNAAGDLQAGGGYDHAGNPVFKEGTTGVELQLTLKDPATPTADYAGYRNGGVLSEAMEITVTLKGLNGAEYGEDYAISGTQNVLDDLKSNGVIEGYTIDQATGAITIKIPLHNMVSGDPTLLQYLQDHLKIKVDILNDKITEHDEGFEVVIETSGNESRPGESIIVNIEDDLDGARIGITGNAVVEGSPDMLTFTVSCSDKAPPEGEVSLTLKFGGTANATGGDPMDMSSTSATSIDYEFQAWVAKMGDKLTGPDADGNYTLTLQPGDWLPNGTYEIKFQTVEDMFKEGNETVTVEIVKVEGAREEVIDTSKSKGTGTIKDDNAVTILISDADGVLYEDPEHAAAEGGSTTAVHTISFTNHADLNGYTSLAGLKVVEDFTFTVRPTSGVYDPDTTDDNTAAGAGDFRWAFQNALLAEGHSEFATMTNVTPDMLAKINDWLEAKGYLPEGVKITAIANNGTITYTVAKGYPLDAGNIKLPVESVDNFKSQGDHKYTLKVEAGDGKNETVGGDTGTGTIKEETGDFLDGFRVGVEAQNINESEGSAAYIVINLYDKAGNKLSESPSTPDGNTKITLVFEASDADPATIFKDYRVDNATLVDGKWQLQITVTPEQWVDLTGGSGGTPEFGIKIPVFVADNGLTDGDRSFTVSIGNVSGNEAVTAPGKGSAEVVITDDTKIPDGSGGKQDYDESMRDGPDVLDGPKIVGFHNNGGIIYGSTGSSSVNEPSAEDPANSDARTEIKYTIAFDHVASEPILIALNLSGGATPGDDFEQGQGLVHITSGMNMTEADLREALGLDADSCRKYIGKLDGISIGEDGVITVDVAKYPNGAFVTVVKAGEAVAEFTVAVKPDHIEESESIIWNIKDMKGSEVITDPTYSTNETIIADDGDGPVVGIIESLDPRISASDPAEYIMNISNKGGEDFTAVIEIVHGTTAWSSFPSMIKVDLGNGETVWAALKSHSNDSSKYEVIIPKNYSGNATVTIPAESGFSNGFFYVGVTATGGTDHSGNAESSASGTLYPGRMDTGGGGSGGGTGGESGGGEGGGGSSNVVSVTGGGAVYEGDTGDSNTITFGINRATTDTSQDCEVLLKVKLGPGCELADDANGPGDFYFGDGVTIVSRGDGYVTIKVTIPAGANTVDLTAHTIGDETIEADESFTLMVVGGTNVEIDVDSPGSSIGTGTILNDDFPDVGNITVTLVDTVSHNGEEGFWEGTSAKVHVDFPEITNPDGSDTLTHPITLTITYTPTGVDGAVLGADYTPQVYTVTVPAGTSISSLTSNGYDFSVHLPDNAVAGGNVHFDVTVKASVAGGESSDFVTVTILDDAGTVYQDGPKILMHGYVENGKTGTSGMDYISENVTGDATKDGRIVVDFTANTVPSENVTITLQLSGLDRVNLPTLADGTPGVYVFDSQSGNYVIKAITFTDSANTQGTVDIGLNAGYNKAGIVLNPLDDALSNGNSLVEVKVIGIAGNEARIVDGSGAVYDNPATGAQPGYSATVVDDGTAFNGDGVSFPAAADGPKVSIGLAEGAASGIGESESSAKDTAFEVTFSKAGAEKTVVTLQITKAMLDRIDLYDGDGNPHAGGDMYMKVEIGGVSQYAHVDVNGNFSVSVPSGTGSFTVPVHLNDDLKTQGDTSLAVKITGVSGSEATVGTSSQTVSVTDNTDGPQISLSSDTPSVIEGDTGDITTVTYNLTLTQPTEVTAYEEGLHVTLKLGGGTATFGTDYGWGDVATALAGYSYTLNGNVLVLSLTAAQLDTLLAGGDGKTFGFDIPVNIIGDDKVEGNETFGMSVATTGSESSVIGDTVVNTTILDDDHAPDVKGETAIFMWDGSSTTLDANVLFNDKDVDGDKILIHDGDGNNYRGDFSIAPDGSHVTFTIDPNNAIFNTLGEGHAVTGNMGFDYSVKDEHGNVSSGTAHMDVEVHRTHEFDGSSFTHDLIIQGTGGNDVIIGGSGDDYIRGGLGDDEMWGGLGNNSFVWEVEDIASSGLDKVMDFTMGNDRLYFDDAINIRGIFDDLSKELKLDVTVGEVGGSDAVTQQVIVHFEENAQYHSFINDYAAANESAKDALVEQLITSITG